MHHSILTYALATVLLVGCGYQPPIELDGRALSANDPRIELVDGEGQPAHFEVIGLGDSRLDALAELDAERRGTVLQLFVATAPPDAPPVAGIVSVEEGRLCFRPRYSLEPGVSYRVVLHKTRLRDGPPGESDLVSEFRLADPPPRPSTVVEHIYPTTDTLPENQLKFYLHFSAPMSRGEAYRRIRLLDAEGREVEAAFLELGEELWDPAMTRFTLLCDPGRVKRGLKPREELGPVLEAGKSYALVVDSRWPDAHGTPLGDSARKSFRVVEVDDDPIDPSGWKIEPPPAGGTGELVVRFPEPLDHSLLERVVWIVDSEGQRVAGSVETADGETCWRFTPARPWTAGAYELVAATTLEDLAGNSIGRAFDADVFERVEGKIETQTVSAAFTISGN